MADSPLPLPAAIIQPIVKAIEGPVNTLLLNTIWCSFLIPMGVALLLSNSRNWKTPVFTMNVCAVALGLAFGVVTIYVQKRSLALNPVDANFLLALTYLYSVIPICTQSILLVRVLAVYPPRQLTWARRFLIYGTLAALQTARVVNIVLDFIKTTHTIYATKDFIAAELSVWKVPYVKVEIILQLVYDVFTSTLFLLRLHEGGALRTKQAGQPSVFTRGEQSTYASRLRALFWIAVFNFIFPVILNIILAVFLFRDPNPEHAVNILVVNVYVNIICVLLATVWCSGTHWHNANEEKARVPEEMMIQSVSTATFAPPSTHTLHTQLDVEIAEGTK